MSDNRHHRWDVRLELVVDPLFVHRYPIHVDRRASRSHYPTRKISLKQEGVEAPLLDLTPGQLVEMVWALTLEAWTFKDGRRDEPRLRRDAVRVVRGRG